MGNNIVFRGVIVGMFAIIMALAGFIGVSFVGELQNHSAELLQIELRLAKIEGTLQNQRR